MSSSVEQIKERIGIAEVVGSYVKLEKAGSNYKARCPFHNEKTPSFFVSPARGSYYCFGCNAKGDIFSFVEQFEGLDFVGALKVLAGRAGVELVRENPQAKSERDRLYSVLEKATEFFAKSLSIDAEAKSYLEKRGVKNETIREWRLGFAPDSWRALYDELVKRGFSSGEMQAVGLIKKSDKSDPNAQSARASISFFDFFRGRIMFPIFDSSDRVIGFSGRILPRLDDGKTGKYVNSPETVLFNKSRVLYGLNKAKFDIRKRDYSIMVEGQMDLIMSHQAGFTNTVAVSGTALSSDTEVDDRVTNLGLLTRLSNNLILAFDSDDAGFKASQRNGKTALSIGMDVKVGKMLQGDDPADIILRNPKEWVEIIKNSKHIIDFALETLLEKKLDTRKLEKEIKVFVLPYVAVLGSPMRQSSFITKISHAIGFSEKILWDELGKVSVDPPSIPEAGVQASTKILKSDSKHTPIERKILSIYYWQETKDKPAIDFGKFTNSLKEIFGAEQFKAFIESTETIKNDLISQAEWSYENVSNLSQELDELLINLEIENIEQKLIEPMRRLYVEKKGVNNSDISLVEKLSRRKEELKHMRQKVDK